MASLANPLRSHWPEYGIEALGIGAFMLSALSCTVALEHPASLLHQALPGPLLRRALMGAAMGATAIALVYSPWGKRSGAHFNPALTFTFYRLGKIGHSDAAFYALAQFLGAIGGVALAGALLGPLAADPGVRFAVTVPGPSGLVAAFAGELAISLGLMLTVLVASNTPRWNPFTGLLVGGLIALYITLEAPFSGMSMNPARTLGSATGAGVFDALWLYFVAPALGMLVAAEVYVRALGPGHVRCAKLHHANARRCIFRCSYAA